ncbi:MAG: hypothetical protein KDD44_12320, partial [Bdellovibrionales bacterium]|nr:hypothetical protein [Bdellovibrionales bacterium]
MGLLVAFLSALFMSFKDMLSKRLSFDVDGSVSAFASFLYALPFYALVLVVLWFAGREPFEFGSAFITL